MEDAVEPDTSSGGGAGAYPVFDDKLLTSWMDVSTEETGITVLQKSPIKLDPDC